LRNIAVILEGKKIKEGFSRSLWSLRMTKGKILKTSACLQQGKDCRMTKKKGKDKKRKGNNKKVLKQRRRSPRFTSLRSR